MTTPDATFLGLRLHDDGPSATLPVSAALCTPFGFLYGGAGLAACAAAAEAVTGRPLVWITTQYVGNAFPDELLEIDVEVLVAGRATSQAFVRGHVGDRLVLQATTAHTDRPAGTERWWGTMPAVPPPGECEPYAFPHAPRLGTSFMDHMERRLPPQPRLADGHVHLWVRVPGWPIGSAASQGFVADIVPMGVTMALGMPIGGTSLDNTVRVVHEEPAAGWVLLEIDAQGFRRSIGHGQVRVWRQDGVLLGIASQTCIVRTSHHDRPLPAP